MKKSQRFRVDLTGVGYLGFGEFSLVALVTRCLAFQ